MSPVTESSDTPVMLFYSRENSHVVTQQSEFTVAQDLIQVMTRNNRGTHTNSAHFVGTAASQVVSVLDLIPQINFPGQGFEDVDLNDDGIAPAPDAAAIAARASTAVLQAASEAAQLAAVAAASSANAVKQTRKTATSEWPDNSTDAGPFVNEAACDAFMKTIPPDKDGNIWGGGLITWRQENWRILKKSTGDAQVRLARCGFSRACSCLFRVRKRRTQGGEYFVSIGNWPHSGHADDKSKSSIPALIKAQLTPSKIVLLPLEYVSAVKLSDAATITGFSVNVETKKALVSLLGRVKAKTLDKGVTGSSGTWGALRLAIQKCLLRIFYYNQLFFHFTSDVSLFLNQMRRPRLTSTTYTHSRYFATHNLQ